MSKSVQDRTLLWGRQGQIFSEAPATAEQAIVEGGLDWDVELRALAFKNNSGNMTVAKGAKAVVRTDTEDYFGTVGGRYQPFQNRQAFSFADELVHSGGQFESAWSMKGGKVVGLTMAFPDHIEVAGDEFNSYIMMKTAHDGSSSIQIAVGSRRMSCLNEFNTNLKEATRRFRVTHSGSTEIKMQDAREALGIRLAYQDELGRELEILAETQMTDVRQRRVLANSLEALNLPEKQVGDQVDAIMSNLVNTPTLDDGQKGTAYGLLNATNEYYQHVRPYRTVQASVNVNLFGLGARATQSVQDHCLDTAAAV